MKIIFMNWDSYGNEDILDAFDELKKNGEDITVVKYPFANTEKRHDEKFENDFRAKLEEEKADLVFSFNYYPLISKTVQSVYDAIGTRYVSWVYDCPHISLYSYTLINKCNDVFIFDSTMYFTFAKQGIETVHFLPMAASVRRLDALTVTPDIWQRFQARIGFVGGLYTEQHTFYDRMEGKLDDYTKGYLEGAMRAQMKVDGVNFMEDIITPRIHDGMQKAMPLSPNADGVESTQFMYAQYFLNRKITQTERSEIFRMIGKHYPMSLYTRDKTFVAEGVRVHGPVDYFREFPLVVKCTDINLNVTLRSIVTGIPMRIFDMMGAGGFVLTNYQSDLLEFFTPGEDFVYYESREDLLAKLDYYLAHDDERRKIAASGHDKIAQAHTFDHRVREILDIVLNRR
ncbi:MAG: glycosyltransferase [Lachnospiraceae bacterium]|nr:glycosyltransferase [Lachnospiraceae bacterium]